MEEALYEVPFYCKFTGIDLTVDTVLNETSICKFRKLLERHDLATIILAGLKAEFEVRWLLLRQCSIIDAKLIAVLPSTKDKMPSRYPEISFKRKDNQWCFGTKAHIGVDADSGIVRGIVGNAVKVGGAASMEELPHDQKESVHGDGVYTSKIQCMLTSDHAH